MQLPSMAPPVANYGNLHSVKVHEPQAEDTDFYNTYAVCFRSTNISLSLSLRSDETFMKVLTITISR